MSSRGQHLFKAGARYALTRAFGVRTSLARPESVLLTFDDGPHREVTSELLDLLASHGARAVFFVMGCRAERAPDLINAIARHGHTVGNHSYAHRPEEPTSMREVVADLSRCQRVLTEQLGAAPEYFRPPLGLLRVRSLAAARVLGMTTMLWSVDCEDWRLHDARGAAAAGELLGQSVRAGDIVLLHEHIHVLQLLRVLLPALRERGLDVGRAVEQL